MSLTPDEIAETLELTSHPAGGRYRETFRDEFAVTAFHLLIAGETLAWTRLDGEVEVWQFYDGAPLALSLAEQDDTAVRVEILSREGERRSQVGVPSGWRRSAETTGEWSLIGITTAPAFDLPDHLAP